MAMRMIRQSEPRTLVRAPFGRLFDSLIHAGLDNGCGAHKPGLGGRCPTARTECARIYRRYLFGGR